jgi:8-oxo-dGTP pyrophosphatase MutT (NUDIX family)
MPPHTKPGVINERRGMEQTLALSMHIGCEAGILPSMRLSSLSPQEIAIRLARAAADAAQPAPVQASTPREAAVLLTLFRRHGQWRLLFIRRACNPLDQHSGEVAFPGGRLEVSDATPEHAALREADEEIALAPRHVTLLGRLPVLMTHSRYRVTPIVGHIAAPTGLAADPAEVARIFSIPLSWLADPRHHEIRPWRTEHRQPARQVIFFRHYQGEQLWGVSARITLTLIGALSHPGSAE